MIPLAVTTRFFCTRLSLSSWSRWRLHPGYHPKNYGRMDVVIFLGEPLRKQRIDTQPNEPFCFEVTAGIVFADILLNRGFEGLVYVYQLYIYMRAQITFYFRKTKHIQYIVFVPYIIYIYAMIYAYTITLNGSKQSFDPSESSCGIPRKGSGTTTTTAMTTTVPPTTTAAPTTTTSQCLSGKGLGPAFGCFQKKGYPKLDGENNGKPY